MTPDRHSCTALTSRIWPSTNSKSASNGSNVNVVRTMTPLSPEAFAPYPTRVKSNRNTPYDFPRALINGLPGANVRDAVVVLHVDGTVEHERVLVELGDLEGLLPALRQAPGPRLHGVAHAAHYGHAVEHGVVAVAHERVVDELQAEVLAYAVER